MTNPIQFRQINAEIVRQMAESLMLLNGSTTIMDIKMALRQQSYKAVQSEVATYMSALAIELGWGYRYQKGYRVYYMDPEAPHISPEETLNNLFQHQADISGLPLNIFLEYRHYFSLKVEHCRLSYYGVIKSERQLVQFYLHGQICKGYFINEKESGYEFSFNAEDMERAGVHQLLNGAHWNAIRTPISQKYLLGERSISEKAFLPSGERMGNFRIKKRASNTTTTQLLVSNAKLYRVDLKFTNGKELVLKRTQTDLKRVLLPLVRKLLRE